MSLEPTEIVELIRGVEDDYIVQGIVDQMYIPGPFRGEDVRNLLRLSINPIFVTKLLQNTIEFEVIDTNRAMILIERSTDPDFVQLVLNNTSLKNLFEYDHGILIYNICTRGDMYADIVQVLINNGANPNLSYPGRLSAFDFVCREGYIDLYDVLEPVAIINPGGVTSNNSPLIYAIDSANIDIMERLINAGADVNFEYGFPLYEALHSANIDVLITLLQAGADITLQPYLVDACGIGRIDKFDWLVLYGANLHNQKTSDVKCLQAAIGNLEMLERVLNLGADINAVDEKGHSALIFASLKNDINTVKFLLEHGADPDLKTISSYKGEMSAREYIRANKPRIADYIDKFTLAKS